MAAMMRIRATVCMYSSFRGTSSQALAAQVAAEAMAITKVTASPMPRAVSIFFDTPINGQMPMNFTRMKFSVSTAVRTMARISFISRPPPCSFSRAWPAFY